MFLAKAFYMPKDRILIRVYGDSLTCPRIDLGIPYFDIYQELLADRCRIEWPNATVYVTTRSRPDAPITELYEEAYIRDSIYFGKMSTDVLIIHCGICDCAPRPIPRWVRNLIGGFPQKILNLIIGIIHNSRARILRAGFLWRLTKPDVFRVTYIDWLRKAAQDCRLVYAINIAPTTHSNEMHSPGLSSSISLFDHFISDAVKFVAAKNIFLIDAHREIISKTNGVMTYIDQADGHHLTREGHILYSNLLTDLTVNHLNDI